MLSIIDADLIVYRAAFAAENKTYHVTTPQGITVFEKERDAKEYLRNYANDSTEQGTNEDDYCITYKIEREPLVNALHNARACVEKIEAGLERIGCTGIEFYLTGSSNFRKETATIQPYKGNRSEFSKPYWYKEIREYLVRKYKAVVIEGQEADDECGIRQTECQEAGLKSVIISNDKDLDTIPGLHYNWIKDEYYEMSEVQALRCFYKQMLTGDTTDNIPGLWKVGPKTADKIIDPCSTERGMFHAVRDAYKAKAVDGLLTWGKEIRRIDDALLEIGNLLYIRKRRNELWSFPL